MCENGFPLMILFLQTESHTGHFLDTDMSTIGRATSIATVFSPTVAVTSNKVCLQFYYHMYGSALDSLHVYKKQGSVTTLVYNDTGNVGDFWKFAEVTTDAQSGSIQVCGVHTFSKIHPCPCESFFYSFPCLCTY